jgi:hypothetical protein
MKILRKLSLVALLLMAFGGQKVVAEGDSVGSFAAPGVAPGVAEKINNLMKEAMSFYETDIIPYYRTINRYKDSQDRRKMTAVDRHLFETLVGRIDALPDGNISTEQEARDVLRTLTEVARNFKRMSEKFSE